MMTTVGTDWMTTGFVGYGRLAADLWLLGMEEHCLDDADAATRLSLLPSFPHTIGVIEAHRRYGFATLPRGVAVWDIASELAAACGLNSSQIGEADGDLLLTELLPLPRPTNDDTQWPAAYQPLFVDYDRYETVMLTCRANRYARLIVEHAPRVVVVHGARYHRHVEAALRSLDGARDPRGFALSNKPAHVIELGRTRIVLVHNFGRAAGWSVESRARLSRFVAALWRGEPLDEFETAESEMPIESLLAGMFHHRAGNVLPREVAMALPGYRLHASKASVNALVQHVDFHRWATRPMALLGGRTPVAVCIARDLADLLNDAKRHTRLRKRYGGDSADELRAAVSDAHDRIRSWMSSGREI